MDNPSDTFFWHLIVNDIAFVCQVIWKIISGLFLSPDGAAVSVVFLLGALFIWLKNKEDNTD